MRKVNVVLQVRRGTTAEWAATSRVLLDGEPGLDTILDRMKYGDGVSLWAALPWSSDGTGGGGGTTDLAALTVDTGEEYRLVLFADGTVRAIPADAVEPSPATSVVVTPRLSSVRVTWTASATPNVTYRVYRNGALVRTTDTLSYRDTNIASGATYSYTVVTVNAYGLVSNPTAPVTGFVDPTSNHAPSVIVTAWPPIHSTNGQSILRVCALDADAQGLTLALSVNAGSVTPTDDPSIWLYTPAGA